VKFQEKNNLGRNLALFQQVDCLCVKLRTCYRVHGKENYTKNGHPMMGAAYSTYGRDVKFVQNFGWEGKRPLGRSRCRWNANKLIRMSIREIVWQDVDWAQLAHERNQWRALVNKIMILRILQKTRNFLTI
jgi:hypothetical protein